MPAKTKTIKELVHSGKITCCTPGGCSNVHGLSVFRLMARALVPVALAACASLAWSGAFLFTNDNPGNIIHPSNYTGNGGPLTVEVCIATDSESQAELVIPVENALSTWNRLEPVTGNLKSGTDNNVPPRQLDIESVLLHEVGHCLGENHPNLATESGKSEPERNYTKAQVGVNNAFDLDDGSDNVIGSADDLRGDDINLHWSNADNNPFTIPSIVDASTYSRDLADLPSGDNYAANADRNVATLFGLPANSTEAVMQQGTPRDEAQRELNHDDVATLRLGMSGLDEAQGTADDYQVKLEFGGVKDNCNINIKLLGRDLGFCNVTIGLPVPPNFPPNHKVVRDATIGLGSATNFNWFFNDQSSSDIIFKNGFESD